MTFESARTQRIQSLLSKGVIYKSTQRVHGQRKRLHSTFFVIIAKNVLAKEKRLHRSVFSKLNALILVTQFKCKLLSLSIKAQILFRFGLRPMFFYVCVVSAEWCIALSWRNRDACESRFGNAPRPAKQTKGPY